MYDIGTGERYSTVTYSSVADCARVGQKIRAYLSAHTDSQPPVFGCFLHPTIATQSVGNRKRRKEEGGKDEQDTNQYSARGVIKSRKTTSADLVQPSTGQGLRFPVFSDPRVLMIESAQRAIV